MKRYFTLTDLMTIAAFSSYLLQPYLDHDIDDQPTKKDVQTI